MKIKDKNYLGLGADYENYIADGIYNRQKKIILEKAETVEEQEAFCKEVWNLTRNYNNKNYLMTEASLKVAERIKINEDKFDGKMFSGLPLNRKISILIDSGLFYRYMVQQDSILCMMCEGTYTVTNGVRVLTGVDYNSFRINTKDGWLSFPKDNPFQNKNFQNFLKYLIFLEFSTLETVCLKPSQKNHVSRKIGKVVNESSNDVVIVDSTWNTIIKVGSFNVSGHLRLQCCGVGKQGRKLIYIEEYAKKGYCRRSKKQIIEN